MNALCVWHGDSELDNNNRRESDTRNGGVTGINNEIVQYIFLSQAATPSDVIAQLVQKVTIRHLQSST